MIGPLHLEMRDRPALKELVAAMEKLSRRQRNEIARIGRRAKAAKQPRLRRLACETKAEAKRFYRDNGGGP
jgi:hypothetical protein